MSISIVWSSGTSHSLRVCACVARRATAVFVPSCAKNVISRYGNTRNELAPIFFPFRRPSGSTGSAAVPSRVCVSWIVPIFTYLSTRLWPTPLLPRRKQSRRIHRVCRFCSQSTRTPGSGTDGRRLHSRRDGSRAWHQAPQCRPAPLSHHRQTSATLPL